ncbi:MAG TPA: substrate-binding domain-containing protein, partial [bacterium]|nr:substrate-binding domain-containing protein [bacterium]
KAPSRRRQAKQKPGTALGFVSFWQCSPDFSETYYQKNLTGVIDGLTRTDYPLLLKNYQEVLAAGAESFHFLNQSQLAGAVVMAPRMKKDDLKLLKHLKIPVVLLYHQTEGKDFSWVDLNNREGGRMAMEHLLSLGHRRIGYIGGELEMSTNARDRYAAYQASLRGAGLVEDPRIVRNGMFSSDYGRKCTEELLALPVSERPTALFCATDMIAFGALQAARNKGAKVPQDLSIVGFDNYDQSAYQIPPLTTIHQPFYDMGRIAMELLESIVQDPKRKSQQVLLEPELVVRSSTGTPPIPPSGHKTSTF